MQFLWCLIVLLVGVYGDDSNIVDSKYFNLGGQQWYTYNLTMIDWEPPYGQIPWVSVAFPTAATAAGVPLAVYAAIGNTEPTIHSPFTTNHVDVDADTGLTTLTMYISNPPNDGGFLQVGVYNPNTFAVARVNLTLSIIPDTGIDQGESPDEEIESGSFAIYHLTITQQQVHDQLSFYFYLTTEDSFEGVDLYAKFGDYALPGRYDYNITYQTLSDDSVDSMFIWIPQDQLKAGTWYFYIDAVDGDSDGGDDDTLTFNVDAITFEEIELHSGNVHIGSVMPGQFDELSLTVDPAVARNSPLLVDVKFSGISYKDVKLYGAKDFIATYDHHEYESCSTDQSTIKELVLPPGIGASAPTWFFQVTNTAPDNVTLLTYSITATFFPISAMSYTPGYYELKPFMLAPSSYYYIVTHDLDEKGPGLVRVIVSLNTVAMSTNVLVFGREAVQQPDKSLPTFLNHQYTSTPLDRTAKTVTYCVTMGGSFTQPTYVAIYNADTSAANIGSVTLDFPTACTDPFAAPATTNNDGGSSIGFGGLGEYGLIAVVAGGVLTTIFAICCMHKWLKGKDEARSTRASLQDTRSSSRDAPPARKKSSKKKGKGDSYAPLNNDRDDDDDDRVQRVTAVEDL